MRVVDSHTEGEPTRLVVEGGPDLGSGPLSERRRIFAERFDHVRRFSLNEPRGFEAIVGALLVEPVDPTCAAGLIFYNNAGTLGMCGHGTIGAIVTLAHMGRIGPGAHRVETPVGVVTATLEGRNTVTIDNVPAFVHARDVAVEVEGIGRVVGDVAWGGNWFFLTENAPCALDYAEIPRLTAAAGAVKTALARVGVTGVDGAEIDHVEFFQAGTNGADSRNFVLCPGAAYDRSPCGTGTSAKLACLAARGTLAPGAAWVQESIVGSRFTGVYSLDAEGRVRPRITGRAFVTAEATLLLDPADPFPYGLG
ncbi:MAG: proline racemase family protein [Hyphomicrobiales bacterium]|nr:proline racemase family protein [Hyphomicrobiales bacterium]